MSDNIRYSTWFELTWEVNSFSEAAKFLAEVDQTEYLHEYTDDATRGVVTNIEWILEDEWGGHVVVDTTRELTDDESKLISNYILDNHQFSLGVEFERRSFADPGYYEPDLNYDFKSQIKWQNETYELTRET